jgi:tetratricopeptide (TPR) repeat protein
MKQLLPLLLAAACCHAHAALDAGACKPGPANLQPGAIPGASARLAAARSEPGERRLALADALADLALLSARQNGSPDIAAGGNPSAAELLGEALTIWQGAPHSAGTARSMQAHGVESFNSRQCKLARELLEPALRMSTAAAGPNDAASVAIAQDLMRIGLAQGDAFLVRGLAPSVAAALDARTQLLDAQDGDTVLALVDFYYNQPGDSGQDLQQAERLARRGLALSAPGAALGRVLSYRVASIYYAQLRFADGEALRTRLARERPPLPVIGDYFTGLREAMTAQVRQGRLQPALATARMLLDGRQKGFDTGRLALAQAEAAVAQARIQAQQDRAAPSLALSQALRNSAQARTAQNMQTFWLAQAHSYVGEILHAMGDHDGAAGAYEAALAGFGEGHPGNWRDRIRTRSDLAILYRMRGDAARAMQVQQQVLDELLPVLGEDHPDVKEARAELALLRKLQHG